MENIDMAIQCFHENLNSFYDANKFPEKYNLYGGLEHMAIAIQTLLSKIEILESEVGILRRILTPNQF
jgi:hypothetical protein